MPTPEQEIERLEQEFPTLAGIAFAAARQRALDAGESVLHSENGFIYEVFPDGRRRVIKQVNPPIEITPGTKLIIP
jgi:hypothetical protein